MKNKLKNIAVNDAWCAGLQVTVPVFKTKLDFLEDISSTMKNNITEEFNKDLFKFFYEFNVVEYNSLTLFLQKQLHQVVNKGIIFYFLLVAHPKISTFDQYTILSILRAATYEICSNTVLYCAKLLAGRNIDIHKKQQFYEQKGW